MKISTILDHIDSGHMALPEFQRGFVWNRDQVRALMGSLYRRHPVGSLLVWTTGSEEASYRGTGELPPGVVKLILDGQQRMSSLYGVVRGKPPEFFDGDARVFTGLRFHLDTEEFSFYQPIKMKEDPLWIDVTLLMKESIAPFVSKLDGHAGLKEFMSTYVNRLNRVHQIQEVDLHVEEVTGKDKTVDVVVDIFNRVNSGGTKLSKGDLALAKVCASYPEAREHIKAALDNWAKADFQFDVDWLLRSVNTILTGEAKFSALHDVGASEFAGGLKRAEKTCNYLLNVIGARLGLDHDRVLFGRYAFPVMAHYVDRRGGRLANAKEQDKLLFWYLHSALWGRFSGSTETKIDRDLEVLKDLETGLDGLLDELRLWRGDLLVKPEHFGGWSRGARFYPALYLLTRIGEALDWGSGIPLKRGLLGKQSSLERHHIFPRALLRKHGFKKPQVNALANFCFLTQDTNLKISDRAPAEYFPQIQREFPGALQSQWIPMEPELWRVERYLDFLAARRDLLAEATNNLLDGLWGGADDREQVPAVEATSEAPSPELAAPLADDADAVPGTVETEEEEAIIFEVRNWVVGQGLPRGVYRYEVTDPESGDALAVLDLAWPNGLQEGFSQPVALLIDEDEETLEIANGAGFRYFTNSEALREYIRRDILAADSGAGVLTGEHGASGV